MAESPRPLENTDAQAWVLRSRALLQQSADNVDGATRSRLTRARQSALEQLDDRAVAPRWVRGFGLAAVSLGLALVVWRGLVPMWMPSESAPSLVQPTPMTTIPAAEPIAPASPRGEDAPVAAPDFELLVDAENYPLLEDLEFYAWLDQAEDRGG